jgi:hypothetical protein
MVGSYHWWLFCCNGFVFDIFIIRIGIHYEKKVDALKGTGRIVLITLFTMIILGLTWLTPQSFCANTPVGYDANDYQRLRNYLELPNGAKRNGNMIGDIQYNQNNPATWNGVTWSKAKPKRITGIDWHEKGLVGSLNMADCKLLRELNCRSNQLKRLDVTGCEALSTLECDNNQINSLNITGCKSLQSIDCSSNNLADLNVSTCKALEELRCNKNQLSNLNLEGSQNLEKLSCFENRLTKLNMNNCRALRELQCSTNQLQMLDLNGCPKLAELYCCENRLTFASLLITVSLPRGMFNCLPQADILIGTKGEVVANEVIDLSREANVGKAATEYVWYNDQNQIIKPSTAINGKFTFDSSYAGQRVSCRMRNAKFPYWDLWTTEVLIKTTSDMAAVQAKLKLTIAKNNTQYPIVCPSELGPAPKNVPVTKVDVNSDGLDDMVASYPWGGSALYINCGKEQYYRAIRSAGKIGVAAKKKSNWAPIFISCNRTGSYEDRDWNEDCSTLIDGKLYREDYFPFEYEAEGNPSIYGEGLIEFDGVSYKPSFYHSQSLGIYAPVYRFEYQNSSEPRNTIDNLKGFYCEFPRSKYSIRVNYDVEEGDDEIPWERRLFHFGSVYFAELNGDNQVDAVVSYYYDDGGSAGADNFAALLLNGGNNRFVYSGEVGFDRDLPTLKSQKISIDGKGYTAIVYKPITFIRPGERLKPDPVDLYQLYIYQPVLKEFLRVSAVPGRLKSTFVPLDRKQFEKILNPPVLRDK